MLDIDVPGISPSFLALATMITTMLSQYYFTDPFLSQKSYLTKEVIYFRTLAADNTAMKSNSINVTEEHIKFLLSNVGWRGGKFP